MGVSALLKLSPLRIEKAGLEGSSKVFGVIWRGVRYSRTFVHMKLGPDSDKKQTRL
jgi:hypothetical protein